MADLDIPDFFITPQHAWIMCESHKVLSPQEVACEVMRTYGDTNVIITTRKFFDETHRRVAGLAVAAVKGGKLVDFPSGDRLAVPTSKVYTNGSTVGS